MQIQGSMLILVVCLVVAGTQVSGYYYDDSYFNGPHSARSRYCPSSYINKKIPYGPMNELEYFMRLGRYQEPYERVSDGTIVSDVFRRRSSKPTTTEFPMYPRCGIERLCDYAHINSILG